MVWILGWFLVRSYRKFEMLGKPEGSLLKVVANVVAVVEVDVAGSHVVAVVCCVQFGLVVAK